MEHGTVGPGCNANRPDATVPFGVFRCPVVDGEIGPVKLAGDTGIGEQDTRTGVHFILPRYSIAIKWRKRLSTSLSLFIFIGALSLGSVGFL